MAKLIYSVLASLDGYIEDEDGNFDWAAPDEEVHRFVNDRERGHGTYLFGRRMYETMVVWEDRRVIAGLPSYAQEYAPIWQAAEKIVFSRTLDNVASARTRIEREFDVDAIRRLKERASKDIGIGGAELAAHALTAGVVDEYYALLAPVAVGGGKRALPKGLRLNLRLLDERRFASGFVYVHYAIERLP